MNNAHARTHTAMLCNNESGGVKVRPLVDEPGPDVRDWVQVFDAVASGNETPRTDWLQTDDACYAALPALAEQEQRRAANRLALCPTVRLLQRRAPRLHQLALRANLEWAAPNRQAAFFVATRLGPGADVCWPRLVAENPDWARRLRALREQLADEPFSFAEFAEMARWFRTFLRPSSASVTRLHENHGAPDFARLAPLAQALFGVPLQHGRDACVSKAERLRLAQFLWLVQLAPRAGAAFRAELVRFIDARQTLFDVDDYDALRAMFARRQQQTLSSDDVRSIFVTVLDEFRNKRRD